jgi:hypothetical protein
MFYSFKFFRSIAKKDPSACKQGKLPANCKGLLPTSQMNVSEVLATF